MPTHIQSEVKVSKRFTDTDKWNDPWFRKLKPEHKLFWVFVLDSCDNCGVWDADIELAEFLLNVKFKEKELISVFNAGKNRIEVLGDGKWLVVDFISFHYGELSDKSVPHAHVKELLRRHNIKNYYVKGIKKVLANAKGTPSLAPTLAKEYQEARPSPTKTETETDTYLVVIDYWNSKHVLPKCIALSTKRTIHIKERWKSEFFRKNYKKAIDNISTSDFCLGKTKKCTWKANIDWFIRSDDALLKALEGTYDGQKKDVFSQY